jgi:hypothetical protein
MTDPALPITNSALPKLAEGGAFAKRQHGRFPGETVGRKRKTLTNLFELASRRPYRRPAPISARRQRGDNEGALSRRHATILPPPGGTSPQRARKSGPQDQRRITISCRGLMGGNSRCGGGALASAGGGASSVGAAAAGAGAAGAAAGGCSAAGAAAPPPAIALTADWQAVERDAIFCCRHSSEAFPPVGTDAQ